MSRTRYRSAVPYRNDRLVLTDQAKPPELPLRQIGSRTTACAHRGFGSGTAQTPAVRRDGETRDDLPRTFSWSEAVPFIDDGHLGLTVWCKEDAGGVENAIRYGIAITIEAEAAIPIYNEIEQRLGVTPRPRR